MRTVGIIAEYNPFHTGHEYHIQKAKKAADADYAVIVMSPDYVQRGEPAAFDKHTRAHMALLGGADLVLELPVCYSTGSAEYFAEGAVALLSRLGVVDVLCFGAERDDRALFEKTASVLLEEPLQYTEALRSLLKQGKTFPRARSEALTAYLCTNNQSIAKDQSTIKDSSFSCTETGCANADITESFLASPNNILGIEYCKALKKQNSRIKPLPIKRVGSHYNSTTLDGTYCSATAIRQAICDTDTGAKEFRQSLCPTNICSQPKSRTASVHSEPDSTANGILRHIPQSCRELFLAACNHCVTPDDLLPYLVQKLLSSDSFDRTLDIGKELSDRIRTLRYSLIGASWADTIAALKTKQITQSRIQRALLHLILSIETQSVEHFRQNGIVYYANVLGFHRDAAPLLRAIKELGEIPLFTKPSQAPSLLSGSGLEMWQQDVYASHLYRSILSMKCAKTETPKPFKTIYETSPVLL